MTLASTGDSSQSGGTSSLRHQEIISRGRVRTGCLICRARKIKCDEQRPVCQRCTKARRRCVYKRAVPSMPLKRAPPMVDHQEHHNDDLRNESFRRTQDGEYLSQGHLFGLEHSSSMIESRTVNSAEYSAQPFSAAVDVGLPSCDNNGTSSFHEGVDLNIASSPSARFYTTSFQMYITTTLDWLGASGISSHSFAYFVEEVDSPTLSPFDHLNWKRIKLHIAQGAIRDESIAAAILVVQNVYRAQVNRLSMLRAVSEYEATIDTFDLMVTNATIDFDSILIVAFLLSLCEIILPNEDGPAFRVFTHEFETRLTVWLSSINRSPISLRICTWLQFLHVATKRSGCCGLLPEKIFALLGNHIIEIPNHPVSVSSSDSASAMYDLVSAPVFNFYLELQRISNQIQDLSHYRRSRTTPADQAEVTDIVNGLKDTLSTLWDTRPSPLQFQPRQLRGDFTQMIAEPLIALAGLCIASYYSEIVGLRRLLGDDPFPSPESEQAMRQIRNIVDGEWNVGYEGALNPGYVRPLFIYAIEALQLDETQWAVARLKQVKSPVSRSEFIATLAEAMGKAQRMEKRRVATKYFCNSAFNVMVPRM